MDHQVVLSFAAGIKHSLCSFDSSLAHFITGSDFVRVPCQQCLAMQSACMVVSRCASLCQICSPAKVDVVPGVTKY